MQSNPSSTSEHVSNHSNGDADNAWPKDPPTYSQATEPPPSYQSIFGEIKEVRRESSNVLVFLVKLSILLGSTIGVAVFLGILLAIPITMIVLGGKYKNDCPAEDKIPIYLIVMGAVLIYRNLSNMCTRCSNDSNENEDNNRSPPHKFCDSIVDVFVFCWFICGNYWIYHIHEPSYDAHSHPNDYCNKTLYLFSFWLMTASYIFVALLCCCICAVGGCAIASEDSDN